MPLYLYVACTNSTSLALNFEAGNPDHGTVPTADPSPVNPGFFSAVSASPNDTVFGPSPEGSFTWALPNDGGQFTFDYNLHASTPELTVSEVPPGYTVPVCVIDSEGNGKVEIAAA